MKSVALWAVVVLLAPLGSVELVVCPGLLGSGLLEDVFPGRGCWLQKVCGTYVEVVLDLLEIVGSCS